MNFDLIIVGAGPGGIFAALELADSGEVIYTSPELQPGEYLEYDLFEKELEKGEYDVTATIFANDPDTGEEKGVFSENIQIIVKNKLF